MEHGTQSSRWFCIESVFLTESIVLTIESNVAQIESIFITIESILITIEAMHFHGAYLALSLNIAIPGD